jgi:hypothetical protein
VTVNSKRGRVRLVSGAEPSEQAMRRFTASHGGFGAPVEIARGRTWPAVQAIVEKRRAEAFAEQRWRPGCARCGESASEEHDWTGATEWLRTHRERCAA